MARLRKFDEHEALENALDAFWVNGYEATSVSNLMEATGLAKASLYNALGDKHTVYLRALEVFTQNARRDLKQLAEEEGTGAELLHRWLEHVAGMASCTGVRRGCFMVNSATELAAHDDKVKAVLRRHERNVEGIYRDLLKRGMRDGSLRDDLNASAVAAWLTTMVYGLQVKGKLSLSTVQASEHIEFTMSVLTTH